MQNVPDAKVIDGRLVLAGREYTIPNVRVIKLIGTGANGVVFSGQHSYIDRRVAVKTWMCRRIGDTRDKLTQALKELNKVAEAESRNVIHIYDAGVLGDSKFIYAVLEFAEGLTCDEWLGNYKPNLLSRLAFAESLTNEIFSLSFKGVIHGDPHLRNIMVMWPFVSASCNGIHAPQFKLIDFGTSHFSSKGYSKMRHWRVFMDTIDRLLYPFRVASLWGKIPDHSDTHRLYARYDISFELIQEILKHGFGIVVDADPADECKWRLGPITDGPRPFNGLEQVHKELVRIVEAGELILTPEAIGVGHRGPSRLEVAD